MHNDKGQVTDWLEQIVKDPDEWILFFSSSEVKMLAEDALELLKEQHDRLEQMSLDNKDLRNCYEELKDSIDRMRHGEENVLSQITRIFGSNACAMPETF